MSTALYTLTHSPHPQYRVSRNMAAWEQLLVSCLMPFFFCPLGAVLSLSLRCMVFLSFHHATVTAAQCRAEEIY
jgi:hypothetical protein